MKITEKIINAQTGEEEIIEREETEQEKQERETALLKFAQQESEQNAKAEQRAALLQRLGITEEEAKVLLG